MPFCHVRLRACQPLPEILQVPPKTPGDHLKRRRFELGHTQEQAAKLIGIHPTTVWKWERDGAPPHPNALPGLERYLGFSLAPSGTEPGDRVQAWRKQHHLSIIHAAARSGIAANTLAKLEDGKDVTLPMRMAVAAGLGDGS